MTVATTILRSIEGQRGSEGEASNPWSNSKIAILGAADPRSDAIGEAVTRRRTSML